MRSKQIISLLLVIVLAFGMQSVSFAAEANVDRTTTEEMNETPEDGLMNLLQQEIYYIIDANGNIEVHTKKERLSGFQGQ